MAVSGFEGKGLVNSFHGGDGSTGTLTSPPFEIKRPFLNFLIGGGKFPGQTCMELLVEGKPVRAATGPNDQARRERAARMEFVGRVRAPRQDRDTTNHRHTHRRLGSLERRSDRPERHQPRARDDQTRDCAQWTVLSPAGQTRCSAAAGQVFLRGTQPERLRNPAPRSGQEPDFWVFIEEPASRRPDVFVRGQASRGLEGPGRDHPVGPATRAPTRCTASKTGRNFTSPRAAAG